MSTFAIDLNSSPAITDVMGGQAQMIFATMPTVIQQVKAGRLRGVATLGNARAAATPDLPTIGETVQGFDVANWIGMFAPAGTPAEIVNRLNAEIQKIMQTPEVQKRLETEGAKFIPTTPASFAMVIGQAALVGLVYIAAFCAFGLGAGDRARYIGSVRRVAFSRTPPVAAH